jgi:uncharacterized membrane protein affecting hemolysin expression
LDDLIAQHELVQWLLIILIALLIIYAMFRGSRRPRERAPPQRFSFGRMLLVALFLAGLAFLINGEAAFDVGAETNSAAGLAALEKSWRSPG